MLNNEYNYSRNNSIFEQTSIMKEAVTGVLDYFPTLMCENTSLIHCGFTVLSLYFTYLFMYLFLLRVLCRKWLNITHFVRLCIWVTNKSSQSIKDVFGAMALELGTAVIGEAQLRLQIIGDISMEFHRDLSNLCCFCNCTNSWGGGHWGLTNRCGDEPS